MACNLKVHRILNVVGRERRGKSHNPSPTPKSQDYRKACSKLCSDV